MKNKYTVYCFASPLAILSIINMILPPKIFSQTENRYLKTKPPLTIKSVYDGTYASDIDEYINDQFLFRDQWVSLKTNTELLAGKNDNGRVYFGKNQWLFSIDNSFSQEQYQKNVTALNNFITTNSNQNIQLMLVPTKSTVLSSYLPRYAPVQDERRLYSSLSTVLKTDRFIDLLEVFDKEAKEDLYFRTDHHWTSKGSYLAYNAFTNTQIDGLQNTVVADTFYGTDFRKANTNSIQPETFSVLMNSMLKDKTISIEGQIEPQDLYDTSKLTGSDKYAYYQGGNHALATLQGNGPKGTSILVIKDSFANSLIPFLSEQYETITFIDLRYYNSSVNTLITENSFDDILFVYNIRTIVQDVSITKLNK